jgi:hypothetical protein
VETADYNIDIDFNKEDAEKNIPELLNLLMQLKKLLKT